MTTYGVLLFPVRGTTCAFLRKLKKKNNSEL